MAYHIYYTWSRQSESISPWRIFRPLRWWCCMLHTYDFSSWLDTSGNWNYHHHPQSSLLCHNWCEFTFLVEGRSTLWTHKAIIVKLFVLHNEMLSRDLFLAPCTRWCMFLQMTRLTVSLTILFMEFLACKRLRTSCAIETFHVIFFAINYGTLLFHDFFSTVGTISVFFTHGWNKIKF